MEPISKDHYFILYSNCIPVLGTGRSAIYDLQYGRLVFIPNLLYKIFKKTRLLTIEKLMKHFNNEFDEGMIKYFTHFKDEGLGFFTDNPKQFPPLNLQFLSPEKISNAVIEFCSNSKIDYENIINQLDSLGCAAIEIRIQGSCSMNECEKLLNLFNASRITSIDILIQESTEFNFEISKEIIQNFGRVKNILLHKSTSEDKVFQQQAVIQRTTKLVNKYDCGLIHKNHMNVNLKFFTQSLHFNSCLHGKIAIDIDGNIKNCPSLPTNYGNVYNSDFNSVISKFDFTKLWSKSKNEITICKSCEYRYACMDCRAYLKSPENENSKPLKCGYDPKTMEWENWKENPEAKMALKIYQFPDGWNA
jgi:SPASM domain peptide maturase of grasp-with-spasm system